MVIIKEVFQSGSSQKIVQKIGTSSTVSISIRGC